MDIRKLQRVIVDGLEDVKGQHILVFNTEHLSSLFERVIIASGTSNRQTKSLASSVREAVKGAGFPVPRTEGESNGEWIIVDCGAAVVHVMQPTIRDFYRLEEIWGDKPVRMKIESGVPELVKAAMSADDDAGDEGDEGDAGDAGEEAAKPKVVRRSRAGRAAPVKTGSPPPSAEAWTRGPTAKPGARAGAAKKSGVIETGAARAGANKTGVANTGAARAVVRKRGAASAGAPGADALAEKASAKKLPARKAVAMPGAPIKKAAAKKAAPQRLVTRVVGLKKPPAKKSAIKTGAPAKKAVGRTFGAATAARRAAAKKSTTGA